MSLIFTVRNVVAARLYFHRRLSFCSHAGGGGGGATAVDNTHPTGMLSCRTDILDPVKTSKFDVIFFTNI